MKLHFLCGGRLQMRRSVFLSDAPRGETIEIPVIGALMRHRQGNVLFDTGCHPDAARDAPARWGGLAKVMKPVMGANDTVVAGLGEVGLSPSDVDVVVCSHLHPDHCGCNVFFTRATVIAHAAELAAARAPDAEAMGYLAAEFELPNALETIEGQRDVFGDGRIVLLPLPGHTPGSIGALVALERDGTFLLAADTVPLRAAFDRDVAPRNTWNAEALLGSYAEVRRIEAAGATVVCGHDDAQWQMLRKGAAAYE